MHNKLTALTTPIIYTFNKPFVAWQQFTQKFATERKLMQQNTALKNQVLLLQGRLQPLHALEIENTQLRKLMQSAPVNHHIRLMVAQVSAINPNPFRQELLVNKGSQAQVMIGQAVLDAQGIMGQIIEVTPQLSRVLLLTDARNAMPIIDNRTGLHGILIGQGKSGALAWINVPPTTDVKVGDLLTSSGLDGHYPAGYPVAKVTQVKPSKQNPFLNIQALPTAQFYCSEQVLLMWPSP